MTPSAILRKQAADLLALADALDREPPATIAAYTDALPRLVDTAAAMKITGRSSSWLYAIARRFPDAGLGWRLETGTWQWDARKLRGLMHGEPLGAKKAKIANT